MKIQSLISGDSLSVLDTFADYPASDGWTLKTRLVPRNTTATAIILTAAAEGDDYRTTAAAATTAGWAAGFYSVSQWVEKAGLRNTLTSGTLEILPNPAAVAVGYDARSHLAKTVEMIEKMLEGKAGKDVQEYTIGDRQLKHIPLNELLVWRDKYRAQLAGEEAAAGINKGVGLGRKIWARIQ